MQIVSSAGTGREVNTVKLMETHLPAYCLRETLFGPVAVLWSIHRAKPKICRIVLSKPGASAKQVVGMLATKHLIASCPEINVVVDKIAAFLTGEDVNFSLDMIRLDCCSVFQRKVLRVLYDIPRGRVSTYRLLAKHMGTPNAGRAVGTALATNPFPIIIPCHRAIRSDGALGGYQGGLNMKRTLLEREGLVFRDADHVATRDYFYAE